MDPYGILLMTPYELQEWLSRQPRRVSVTGIKNRGANQYAKSIEEHEAACKT
jgi:hypothetical protein